MRQGHTMLLHLITGGVDLDHEDKLATASFLHPEVTSFFSLQLLNIYSYFGRR